MNIRFYKILSFSALILAIASSGLSLWTTARAQEAPTAAMPTTISYQGYLRDPDGNLTNGTYDITAKIYKVAAGVEEPLYTKTVVDVTVRDGMFNFVLGDDATPFPSKLFANAPLYIGISLNGEAELIPRQRLHAVPWAFQASTLVNNATIYGFTSEGDANVTGNLKVSGHISIGNGEASERVGPHFLPEKHQVFYKYGPGPDGCGATDWVQYDIPATANIPADALAVIFEAYGQSVTAAGTYLTRQLAVRANNDDTWGYPIIQGLVTAPNAASAAVVGQGIYPLAPGGTHFDYKIDHGFSDYCSLYISGYIR